MLSILLCGCNGKMGRAVAELASEKASVTIAAGVDISPDSSGAFPVFGDINDVVVDCDVIVDFSSPSMLASMLEFAKKRRIPAVLCTTGYSDEDIEKIKVASESIPVFFSYNMSMAVALLTELSVKAAQVLGEDYDIEIIEKHHNRKLDAPSGTALKLADEINRATEEKYAYEYDRHSRRAARRKNEIGISSVRGGTIVGEHEVIFAGCDEVLTVKHTAYSRRIFASGALRAAEFIREADSGLYSMKNLV